MKLSIFPKAKSLPKGKDEKREEARYFSRPYLPEVVEIENDDQLIEIVTSFAYSPFVFKKARLQEDFLSTDFLVIDIDSGLTISEAEKRVDDLKVTCLCIVTTSHSPDAHRFRLIFPTSSTITNIDVFLASMRKLVETFPEADPSCVTDYARSYFSGTLDDGFWIENNLLEPTPVAPVAKRDYDRPDTSESVKVDLSIAEIVRELYAEDREFIPEAVAFFIENGKSGLPGNWNNSLNRCVFTLSLQNIEYDVVYELVEFIAPEPLSKSDIFTIKHSYKDGEKYRDE